MPDALAPRFKFGVLAPATNTVVQPEFDALRPKGVSNQMARVVIPDTPVGTESEFELLRRTLAALSPHGDRPGEVIRPGQPVRIFVDDTRDFPTIDFGYGDVPVIHASAGMRRILALAYLVVWSRREHVGASKLLGISLGAVHGSRSTRASSSRTL